MKVTQAGVHPKTLNVTVEVNHDIKLITFKTPKVIAQVSFKEYDEWGCVSLHGDLFDWHILHDETLGVWLYGLTLDEHGALHIDMLVEEIYIPKEVGRFREVA